MPGPESSSSSGPAFEAFLALIARLRAPEGCPWDREQTHRSLRPMTIEEAYEVVEAIEAGDDEDLAGELGDLLLQVVFHAQIASEAGRFAMGDVLARVTDKMVRRHPHVFAGATAATSGEVLQNWEALKEAERAARGRPPAGGSLLDGVSRGLPAVMEAHQMATKAARVGFDWPDAAAVVAKLEEELAELKEALQTAPGSARVEEEVGDLLFAAVNVARLLGTDAEAALKAGNRKFRRRFLHVEERLRETGRKPADSSLEEMEALWAEAKRRETA